MTSDDLKAYIRDVPDFPKPGIIFKDITPLLLHPPAFRASIDVFRERYADLGINKIVAIESRGFFFASPLCYELRAGFIPLRKPGKLPFETLAESYELEYGEAALEIHADAIDKGDRVVIFDDLLATGGTAGASVSLVRQLGGEVVEAGFLVELAFLKGRAKLGNTPVFSLLQYD
jgi:adenine phosphoribosyltransferase